MFISYRRADTGPSVRALATTLRQAFGVTSVFVDTETIRAGEKWPKRIVDALGSSCVMIVVIGPAWLREADDYGRRRLDSEDDWVRREIEQAIATRVALVPVTVGGAVIPSRPALPRSVRRLLDHQAYEIRDNYWEQDVAGLMRRLEELGCRRTAADVKYPKPHAAPKELSGAELERALRKLTKWRLQDSTIAGREPETQTEIVRTFTFAKFEDVIDFMSKAAPYIANMDHHPRWQNIYQSLTISLTTWDIGFVPSRFDVELANFFDRLYRNYGPRSKRRTPGDRGS